MADPRGAEIAKLEALFSANPDGRVFTHLAEAYRRAGEPERARLLLEAGLARHADYASAHVVHGRVLLDLGLEAEAEAAFRRVLNLDPENLVALRALGDLARRAGRAAEALGYYEQLLVRDPSSAELDAIIRELREAGAPQPASADRAAAEWEPLTADAAADAADGVEGGEAGGLAGAVGVAEAELSAESQAPGVAEVEASGAAAGEASAVAEAGADVSEAVAPAAMEEPAVMEAPGPEVAEAREPGVGDAGVAGAAVVVPPAEAEPGSEPKSVAMAAEAAGEGEAGVGLDEAGGAVEPALSGRDDGEVPAGPAEPAWHAAEVEQPAAVGLPPEEARAESSPPAHEAREGGDEVTLAEPAEPFESAIQPAWSGLAGAPAEPPQEEALDEGLDLDIGTLTDLPEGTHSLLFEDEYTDPESAALPLDAWAPLTEADEAGAEPGAADAGAGEPEAPAAESAVASGAEPEVPADEAVAIAEAAVVEGAEQEASVDEAAVIEAAEPGAPAAEAAVFEAGEPEAEVATSAAPEAVEEVPSPEAAGSVSEATEGAAPAESATAVAPSAESGVETAPAAPAARSEAEPGARREPMGGEVVTETLADLYLAQGLLDRAIALYRQLLDRRPGDPRLQARLAEAEARLSGEARGEGDRAGWEVVEEPAGEGTLHERIEDVEAAWTGGAGADGQEDVSPYAWPEDEEAAEHADAGGATIGEYLHGLLRWAPGRSEAPAASESEAPAASESDAPVAEAAVEVPAAAPDVEAASAPSAPESAGGARESDDDDDLEMFRAWLQSLKR